MKYCYWLGVSCLVSSLALAGADVPVEEEYPSEELPVEEPVIKPHFFVRGNLGISSLHYKGADYTSPLRYENKRHFAAFVGLGYQFLDYLALEADYFYAGHPEFKDEKGISYKMTQLGAGLTVNLSYRFKWGISVMGRYGWTWVHREALPVIGHRASDRIVPIYGTGVSFELLPSLTLDCLFTKTISSGNLQTFECYTFGLTYHLPF